jgi:hypothetical protein
MKGKGPGPLSRDNSLGSQSQMLNIQYLTFELLSREQHIEKSVSEIYGGGESA